MNRIPEDQLKIIVDLALEEDAGQGDATSTALIPPNLNGQAFLLVKVGGVLAGGEVVRMVFLRADPSLKVELLIEDGSRIKPGDIIGTISGKVMSILKGERVALNFLQRMSGIATQTARYIAKVRDLPVIILDTRKTTPGLRLLEKYAVLMGGGHNHRFNLGDGILIKDNHLVALNTLGMSFREIVSRAKEKAPPGLKVEVEVTTVDQALAATEAGADIILLDNMTPADMASVVNLVRGKIKTEASGGINLDNVRTVAMSGVDTASIGALTHSPQALDISLELDPSTIRLL